MAVTNTNELKAQIIDWLNRDDLDAVIQNFMENADSRILADSRARGEITEQRIIKDRASENYVNPVPIDSVYYPAWSGFYAEGLDPGTDPQPAEEDLEVDTFDTEFLSVFVDEKEIKRVTVNRFFDQDYRDEYETYCNIGGRLYIKGWPLREEATPEEQEAYKLDVVVHRKTPIDFTATDPTSDLLRAMPLAFFYASMVEASIYLRDPEGIQLHEARYNEFMDKLYRDYKRKQVSAGWSVASIGEDLTWQ